MAGKLKRIREFVATDLWRDAPTRPRLKTAAIRVARVLVLSVRGFFADRCLLHATALAYTTLLSLVPLLAFSFSVAKGLGGQERIQPLVDKWVAMNREDVGKLLAELIERTSHYIRQTHVGILGAIALLFSVWTLISVMGAIETSLNQIWRVERPRTLFRRITDYTGMLAVSPILLLVGMSAMAAFHHTTIGQSIRSSILLGRLVEVLLVFIPTWIAFATVYILMPNTKVRLVPALVGGVVAGTAWQAAFWLYTTLQIGMARYNAIYGAFAALPVFMTWLYVSWAVVLFGAEVSRATQDVK